jgi:hypothetical protein
VRSRDGSRDRSRDARFRSRDGSRDAVVRSRDGSRDAAAKKSFDGDSWDRNSFDGDNFDKKKSFDGDSWDNQSFKSVRSWDVVDKSGKTQIRDYEPWWETKQVKKTH